MTTDEKKAYAAGRALWAKLEAQDSKNMTADEMLEQRHSLKLIWAEPWQARGPDGAELSAHLELRATVHDCINMQRAAAKPSGLTESSDDETYLLDFMAVHWATPDPATVQGRF